MKSKKLLAILLSLCMLLVLVPAFTLMASANETPECPSRVEGSTNYASNATYTNVKNNGAVNLSAGTIALTGSTGTSAEADYPTVTLTMPELTADDYVVSFKVVRAAWGEKYNFSFTFGSNGTTEQKFVMKTDWSFVDSTGTSAPVTKTGDFASGIKFDFHIYRDGANVTVDMFANDTYVYTATDVALDKAFVFKGYPHKSYTQTISELVIYDPNEEVLGDLCTITAEASPAEGGSITGAGEYVEGAEVTLTATENFPNYLFMGWKKDGEAECFSNEKSIKITVEGDATYTAVFEANAITSLPAQGSAINLAVPSTMKLVPAPNGTPATYADGVITLGSTSNAGKSAAKKDLSALAGKDYVIGFDSSLVHYSNGWTMTFRLAGDNTNSYNICVATNGVKFDTVTDGASNAVSVSAAGINTIKIQVYVDNHDNNKCDLYVFVNEGLKAIYKGLAALNPTVELYSTNANTGWNPEISNLVAYEVGTATVHTVDVNNTVGGTVDSTVAEYGEQISLNATVDENYQLLYWEVNNRTYTEETLTLTVKENTIVKPVFVKTADLTNDDIIFTFRSLDGRVVDTLTKAELLAGKTPKDPPVRYGYTNGTWDYSVADTDSNTDVVASYDEGTETYTVTVNGGEGTTEVGFEEKVTITEALDGFNAWQIGGKTVSTKSTYTFWVTDDVTITAVADAEITSDVAKLTLGKTKTDDTYRLTAIVTTFAADGDEFIEAGILYATYGEPDENGKLVEGKKKISTITTDGQFMYSLTGVPAGTEVYVQGYMVVRGANGELHTVYGAIDSITM